MQLWLTMATVGAAVAWLVARFFAAPSTSGCDGCASAARPAEPARGIRPKALRVLGATGRPR